MNIRTVRKKIKTVENIKKITKAMELVSAVKMKKAQQVAIESKPYNHTLDKMIQQIVEMIDPTVSPLLTVNNIDKVLVILISTNKGLCGSFNFNLFRFLLSSLDLKKTEFVTLGKQGGLFLSKLKTTIIADFSTSKAETTVSAIFQLIVSKFLAKQYGQIFILYNQFISTTVYKPTLEIILPFKFPQTQFVDTDKTSVISPEPQYLIEPKPQQIIDSLLRSYIEQKIRKAILSSEAGEHSARMVAMRNATDNAVQLTYDLTLVRNKLRQEKITNELLDMVTAKQSVES